MHKAGRVIYEDIYYLLWEKKDLQVQSKPMWIPVIHLFQNDFCFI